MSEKPDQFKGYTPGPWRIRGERYKFIRVYATLGGIAHLDTVDSEGMENARLIAAAPSLLADNERLTADNERLTADNERLREALDKSLTDEQIRQIAASIDRSMPLKSAKILFARRIEAALRRDAERYRWLREKDGIAVDVTVFGSMEANLDAAIDAAMKGDKT